MNSEARESALSEPDNSWDYKCRMCKAGVKWDGSRPNACPECGDSIDPRNMTLQWNLSPGTTIGKLIEEVEGGR